jgi:serine/threonine-protein phosphatase 2A activator
LVPSIKLGKEFFSKYLPQPVQGASEELIVYLYDSFGSNVRLDYGTGHELNFAQILYCLFLLGVIDENDFESAVHHVFYKYIALMRKIQTVYWLEPAGSQGVWGLDDHHFLPFLFGAAELINHPVAKLPNAIHNETILETLGDDFMYLSRLD